MRRWREQSWCVAEITPEYVEKMDDVLATYERPYDPAEPVICFDEKPVVLREDAYWVNQAEIEIARVTREAIGRDRLGSIAALSRRLRPWK